MKILVADDDRIARKVLRAFLEDASYEVVVVEDGKQAITILEGDDAPPIVILDWVMPGMSGPEVCAKVRGSRLKFRPYVLMLSAKTDKTEVVAGLDAGADDFLSKPFNLAELLARLRVAQRMVEYEVDLRRKIVELEALEQRHRLLGDLLTTPVSAELVPAGPVEPSKPLTTFTTDQLVVLASIALEQLGFGEVRVTEAAETPVPFRVAYCAWVALIAIDDERWIDLVLEAEPAAIADLMEKTLHRRNNTNLPKQAFLAEALTIVSSALRSELRQRPCDTLMPYLSRALYSEQHRLKLPLPDNSRPLLLEVAGHTLRFTVVEQPSPIRRRISHQLRLLEVLAEAYPPPKTHDVALLSRGAVLNERYIEKLTSFAEATADQFPVPVYAPSPLALHFHREGSG